MADNAHYRGELAPYLAPPTVELALPVSGGYWVLTLSRLELNGPYARGALCCKIDVQTSEWACGNVTNQFPVKNYP